MSVLRSKNQKMDKTTLEALETALQTSPENVALRTQIAKGWYSYGDYEKAKEHFNALVQATNDTTAKKDLAKCYFQLKNYSPLREAIQSLFCTLFLLTLNRHQSYLQGVNQTGDRETVRTSQCGLPSSLENTRVNPFIQTRTFSAYPGLTHHHDAIPVSEN